MLTWAVLEGFCAEGSLKRWELKPARLGAPGRRLYMLPSVHLAFEGTWPAPPTEALEMTQRRRAAMRGVVERYVRGDYLSYGADIKELGSEQSPETHMRGYWELRSQGPREQTRLLGFVPIPGAFLATAFIRRGALRARPIDDWAKRHRACRAEWESLFGGQKPMMTPWPVKPDCLKTYTECVDA